MIGPHVVRPAVNTFISDIMALAFRAAKTRAQRQANVLEKQKDKIDGKWNGE